MSSPVHVASSRSQNGLSSAVVGHGAAVHMHSAPVSGESPAKVVHGFPCTPLTTAASELRPTVSQQCQQLPDEVVDLGRKYSIASLLEETADCADDSVLLQRYVCELKKLIRTAMGKQMRLKEGFVNMQRATKDKTQKEQLKKEVRDLSDVISDMQDDIQTLEMYATGTFGKPPSFPPLFHLFPLP